MNIQSMQPCMLFSADDDQTQRYCDAGLETLRGPPSRFNWQWGRDPLFTVRRHCRTSICRVWWSYNCNGFEIGLRVYCAENRHRQTPVKTLPQQLRSEWVITY